MEDVIISVKNIEKSFGGIKILKGISFDVHQGKVLSIIGPSGSGKSTILRCISQLETVDNGSITISQNYNLFLGNFNVISRNYLSLLVPYLLIRKNDFYLL